MVFIFGLVMIIATEHIDKNFINKWATQNNFNVKSIDRRFLSIGPFYFITNQQRCYRIELDDGKIYYMRTGFFDDEIVYYEE